MEEKICKNCRHCLRYYVRYRLHFCFTGKGDCARKKPFVPIGNVLGDTCVNWESREAEEEQIRKDLAKTAFAVVYERIDELISLLK